MATARSKIKPKSQITKEKDDEIAQIKEENARLKELAKKEEIPVIPEIVPKKVAKVYNTPVKQRPKKQEPKPVQQEPTIDYLVDKSYGETLANKLKLNMYQRMMQDTFM